MFFVYQHSGNALPYYSSTISHHYYDECCYCACHQVLEDFNKDSENTVALKVKKYDDELTASLKTARDCHVFHPGDQATMKAAESAHDKAAGITVVWSVRTLLGIPHINHPKKGEGTRIKLKSIYDEHMKDADEANIYWDEKMLADVKKVIEGSAGAAATEAATAKETAAKEATTDNSGAAAASSGSSALAAGGKVKAKAK